MHDMIWSRLVLDAIKDIYSAGASPELWPNALQAVANCFGDRGAILVCQLQGEEVTTVVSPDLAAIQRRYIVEGWMRKDLRFTRALERGLFKKGRPISDQDIASTTEIETHDYYVNFLQANGLKWFAGVSIAPDETMFAALSVQRAMTKPAFTPQELEIVEMLGAHVENALRIGLRFSEAQSVVRALAEVLERLSMGIALLSKSHKVVFQNDVATRLLHRLADGGVAFGKNAEAFWQRAGIPAATKIANGHLEDSALLHTFRTDDGLTAIYIFPVASGSQHVLDREYRDVHAMLVFLTSAEGVAPDPLIVRDLLGLTLSEARLASLIGFGHTPKSASEQLNITEQTARTALKRVFEKSGVRRQSELVKLLTRVTMSRAL